jgi:transposase-like protein
MTASAGHSVPLHCPYCAGEDLHPHGEAHGAWECRECLRAFSVKFLGLTGLSERGRAMALPHSDNPGGRRAR